MCRAAKVAGAALILLPGLAWAQFAPAPWPLQSFHEIQGTITGAAQNVAFTISGVKTWCVLNPSNQSEVIFWRLTAAADLIPGHNGEIAPGTFVCWGGADIVQTGQNNLALSLNAATNPHPYFAFEAQ